MTCWIKNNLHVYYICESKRKFVGDGWIIHWKNLDQNPFDISEIVLAWDLKINKECHSWFQKKIYNLMRFQNFLKTYTEILLSKWRLIVPYGVFHLAIFLSSVWVWWSKFEFNFGSIKSKSLRLSLSNKYFEGIQSG